MCVQYVATKLRRVLQMLAAAAYVFFAARRSTPFSISQDLSYAALLLSVWFALTELSPKGVPFNDAYALVAVAAAVAASGFSMLGAFLVPLLYDSAAEPGLVLLVGLSNPPPWLALASVGWLCSSDARRAVLAACCVFLGVWFKDCSSRHGTALLIAMASGELAKHDFPSALVAFAVASWVVAKITLLNVCVSCALLCASKFRPRDVDVRAWSGTLLPMSFFLRNGRALHFENDFPSVTMVAISTATTYALTKSVDFPRKSAYVLGIVACVVVCVVRTTRKGCFEFRPQFVTSRGNLVVFDPFSRDRSCPGWIVDSLVEENEKPILIGDSAMRKIFHSVSKLRDSRYATSPVKFHSDLESDSASFLWAPTAIELVEKLQHMGEGEEGDRVVIGLGVWDALHTENLQDVFEVLKTVSSRIPSNAIVLSSACVEFSKLPLSKRRGITYWRTELVHSMVKKFAEQNHLTFVDLKAFTCELDDTADGVHHKPFVYEAVARALVG